MFLFQMHQVGLLHGNSTKNMQLLLEGAGFSKNHAKKISTFISSPSSRKELAKKLEELDKMPGISQRTKKEAANYIIYSLISNSGNNSIEAGHKAVGVELAVNLMEKLSNDKAQFPVVLGNAEKMLTLDEFSSHVQESLARDFDGKTFLQVLLSTLPEARDESGLFRLFQSKMPTLTKEQFMQFGRQDFATFLKSVENKELVKFLLQGAIRFGNSDNTLSEVAPIGLQTSVQLVAPELIGIVLAVAASPSENMEKTTAFGSLSKTIRFLAGSEGICLKMQGSICSFSCIPVDISEQYRLGSSSVTALSNVLAKTGEDGEIKAMLAFGHGFVEAVKTMAGNAAKQLISKPSPHTVGSLMSFTIIQFVMSTIAENTKKVSEFTYAIAKKENKEKEKQDKGQGFV